MSKSSSSPDSIIRLPAAHLRTFIATAFERVGVSAPDATSVAGLMTDADLQGSDGHGIFRLPQYIRRIQAGGINPRGKPHILRERAAMALIDGDNALGLGSRNGYFPRIGNRACKARRWRAKQCQ